MISRREVVTAGMLGTLSNAAMAAPGQAQSNRGDAGMEVNLSEIRGELRDMKGILEDGMRRSSLGFGGIGTIRDRLTLYLRSSGKFPDFCEIGTTLFYEVYDWHVKHGQQIQIVRIAEQRFAIQFMFTQLVVRWENDPHYIGQPYAR